MSGPFSCRASLNALYLQQLVQRSTMHKTKISLLLITLLCVTLFGIAHVYTHKNIPITHNYSITDTDINSATGPDGYVLQTPGNYSLATNIQWSVNHPDRFAITIAADNVLLDGKDTTIAQEDYMTRHAIGIQVKTGCKNIEIKNITFHELSGGGIWCRGGNENLTITNCKFSNCGYNGMTSLDAKSIPNMVPRAWTQSILFDGGYQKPIKNAHVLDCVFSECGILRSTEPNAYEAHCGALLCYNAENITLKGCTIDGCIGRNKSWVVTLISISNVQVSDVFITDVFSRGKAEGIFTYDVDGEVTDSPQTGIMSHVAENRFGFMLDNHESYKEAVAPDPHYHIEANHLKGIIPEHNEQEEALYTELKWREFRTLGRLVCHNADTKSKTTAIYGTWVELFCKQVLDVDVQVVNGFANLYTDGNVPLPAHRDQYKKWIIGLSFGDTRTLDFVPDDPQADIVSFPMQAGDVFIFSPEVNNRYEHRMLPEPESKGRRINLTYFLDIAPGQDATKLLRPPDLHKKVIPTFKEAETAYAQSQRKVEKKKVIVQDEKGNFYEELNGKLIPLPPDFGKTK